MVLTLTFRLRKRVQGGKTLVTTSFAGLVLALLLGLPAWANPVLSQILSNTPQSRLQFSPYTVGSVIAGATDRVYILSAQKGQSLRIKVNSTGARAFVMVFNRQGQRLITLTDRSPDFDYDLPSSGDYYIFCHGGPTYHFYDLTVRVN
jgi:hypothetical protein